MARRPLDSREQLCFSRMQRLGIFRHTQLDRETESRRRASQESVSATFGDDAGALQMEGRRKAKTDDHANPANTPVSPCGGEDAGYGGADEDWCARTFAGHFGILHL